MFGKIFLVLISLVVAGPTLATDASSRVESVTVYARGAMVTRVATLDLSAGSNHIRLTGLVRDIRMEGLQIEVAADDVQVGQIKLGREQTRSAFDDDVQDVQAQIDKLTLDIMAIDDSSSAATLRLRFLQGIADGYAKEAWFEGTRGTANIESWQAALDLLQTGTEDANDLIRANSVKKSALNKDLSVLTRRLQELRGGALAASVVEFSLASGTAKQVEVRLHYYQQGASWSPRYEARLNSESGALKLVQQAEITQRTDEDWQNVTLTLSTSEPESALIAPELGSRFLDLYEPRMNAAPLARVAYEKDSPARLEEMVVAGAIARPDVSAFAVNYPVPGRSSVSNDRDEPVSINLAQFEFNVELVTRVVPRQSTQAFLLAKFVYDQALPLQSSKMTVYVDGVYVGETQMPTALRQAEMELPMGRDRRVEVRLESQGGEKGKQGIISKRKSESTDYVFEVINRRSTVSQVEVLDLYPVARNSDIEVTVPRSATPPDERDIDDQPGLVLWRKSLATGETWRIRHQYEITYPAKSVLSGN